MNKTILAAVIAMVSTSAHAIDWAPSTQHLDGLTYKITGEILPSVATNQSIPQSIILSYCGKGIAIILPSGDIDGALTVIVDGVTYDADTQNANGVLLPISGLVDAMKRGNVATIMTINSRVLSVGLAGFTKAYALACP